MKDTITSILTDADVRSDADVTQSLLSSAEVASPWASVEGA